MKVDTNVSTSQMDQNWTRYMVMCDRKDIRQATNFQEENEVQATLVGNKALAKQYEIQNPVDRGTQSTRWILNTPVWTVHNRLVHTGITHVEGGWPKEIDCWRDEELMTRYRRKQEKSEAYVQQMRGLTRVECALSLYPHSLNAALFCVEQLFFLFWLFLVLFFLGSMRNGHAILAEEAKPCVSTWERG